MFQPFLMKLSGLCLGAFSLLSCAPYEKCDESLKVGDELTFKLTEGPSEQEQIEECEGELPFDVGSEFHLTVERFVGGEICDSTTGPLRLGDGSEFQWYSEFDRRGGPKFRGDYILEGKEGCSYYFEFEFYDDGLRYLANGANPNPCAVACTTGRFKGEWVE